MKARVTRFAVPSLAALTLTLAGMTFAQSGTKPSGTPPPAKQPGSDSKPSGTQKAEARAPKVIALNFYADWCAKCKTLKPNLEQAMSAAGEQPCLFVKLDQTDKNSAQSEYLLAALGAGDLWKENAGKTGFVILVDAKTKKVISKITADQSAESIESAINAALKG